MMSATGWGITFVLGLMLFGTIIATVLIWQFFRTVQIGIQSGGAPTGDRLMRALAGLSEPEAPATEEEVPRFQGEASRRVAGEGE